MNVNVIVLIIMTVLIAALAYYLVRKLAVLRLDRAIHSIVSSEEIFLAMIEKGHIQEDSDCHNIFRKRYENLNKCVEADRPVHKILMSAFGDKCPAHDGMDNFVELAKKNIEDMNHLIKNADKDGRTQEALFIYAYFNACHEIMRADMFVMKLSIKTYLSFVWAELREYMKESKPQAAAAQTSVAASESAASRDFRLIKVLERSLSKIYEYSQHEDNTFGAKLPV
uniref:Uncharacterized protein n=1 Tax=Magnetococcus massalia (strain MO-1) TaxID=451514 RepID=A0A1S7LLN2_MAGMO|nr:protein of unknown function [Candidatus Magnetococcus massalia]